MKKFSAIIAVAVSSVVAFTAPAARADALYSNVTVYVWNGVGVPDTANYASQPGTTPTATFTYTGPINFVNNNSQASGNTFENSSTAMAATNYTSDITGFSSAPIPSTSSSTTSP